MGLRRRRGAPAALTDGPRAHRYPEASERPYAHGVERHAVCLGRHHLYANPLSSRSKGLCRCLWGLAIVLKEAEESGLSKACSDPEGFTCRGAGVSALIKGFRLNRIRPLSSH